MFTGIFPSSFTRCLWASCPLLPETSFVIPALSTDHLRLQPGHYCPLPSTGVVSVAAKRWFPTCGRRFRVPTSRPGRIGCPYVEMVKGAGIHCIWQTCVQFARAYVDFNPIHDQSARIPDYCFTWRNFTQWVRGRPTGYRYGYVWG